MNICLVTNYNYSAYLGATLASVDRQTQQFDRIIIVDDGSSDGSTEIIAAFCERRSHAQAIYKDNGGQLSAFHAALKFIGQDDMVFFLDADDLYPSDYLKQLSMRIGGTKADFIFVSRVDFQEGGEPLSTATIGTTESFAFASTSALTRKTLTWIGEATSCICMRGSLLHAILPYPFERDWVTRADDVLILGASILGAHKLFVPSVGVNYRIHRENNFTGRKITGKERADWRLRHERLRKWYSDRTSVPELSPLKNALHEATLIPVTMRRRFGIPSPALLFFYDLLLVVPIFRILWKDLLGCRGR